jgi:hypothetical protein
MEAHLLATVYASPLSKLHMLELFVPATRRLSPEKENGPGRVPSATPVRVRLRALLESATRRGEGARHSRVLCVQEL